MVCKNCPPGNGKGLRLFQPVQYDKFVKPGDTYNIFVSVVNRSMLVGDWGRICLWDGMNLVASSGSFYSVKSEVFYHRFSGIMPMDDLYLNVSVVDEQIYKLTKCVDGQKVHILVAQETVHVDPVDAPEEQPQPDDNSWGPDGEDTDIVQWIMDNLVLILVLILILILVVKFG